MNKPEVFIIGAGSIGCFYACRFSETAHVTLLARKEKVPAFQNGIELDGKIFRPQCRSLDGIRDLPQGALVFITAKAFQLESLWPKLKQWIYEPSNQKIIFCQNGIGIQEMAQTQLPHLRSQIVRMVCWFGTRLEFNEGRPPLLHFPNQSGLARSEFLSGNPDLESLFEQSNLRYSTTSDPTRLEWNKALANVITNGLTAIANATNGAVFSAELRPIADQLLSEALTVAHAKGIQFSTEDTEHVWNQLKTVEKNYNSTWQDLHNHRPTEIPWLNGRIAEEGKKLNIATPANDFIARVVLYLSSHER